jgi:hypothetical protein
MRKWLAPLLVVPTTVGVLALVETREPVKPPPPTATVATPRPAPQVVPAREPSFEERRAAEATRQRPELARQVDAVYRRVVLRAPTDSELAFWTQELVDERPAGEVDEYVALVATSIDQVYRRPPTFGELRHFTDFLDAGSPL